MDRIAWMIIGILLLTPAQARADCEEAQKLRGPIQTVVLSEGQMWTATGEARGQMFKREKWTFSRDRRTITITHYDAGQLRFLNIWASTVCEYDGKGTLLRTRWKPNGLTIESTEERSYDAEGRLIMVKSDDMPDRVLTYTYSGNARTARHPAHNPITTTTERDSSGRIIRETRRDHGEELDAVVEYRYGPGTVETIGRDHEVKWHTISKLDAMGNYISSSDADTGAVVNTTQFDYDAQGNWIKRVQPIREIKISVVNLREIVYFQ